MSYGSVKTPPGYLPTADAARWETLRKLRMLYEGDHRCYFLDEKNTQFNYPDENIDGVRKPRYLTVNLLMAMSNRSADLLFGAKAKIEAPAGSEALQPMIDSLARRSMLHSRLHEAAIQASWAGGAFFEVTRWNEQVYVEVVSADEIYPQGVIQPNGQYRSYLRYATDTAEIAGSKTSLLLKTTYAAGVITRELRKLDDKGHAGGEALPLDQWPAFAGVAPQPVERIGIDACTIIYLPNKVGQSVGMSDYTRSVISLQDSVNAKFAQLARVIAKHADPKLAAPEAAANPEGEIPASADLFFYRSKEEIPQYIVWNAETAAADADRKETNLAFCMAAEMSPAGLGLRQGAIPESARKLKLDMTIDLAKAARKSLVMEPAIALTVEVAMKLDQASAMLRSYPIEPVGVQMRDGLPIDEVDQSTVISNLRAAGVMSVEAGVEMWVQDPAAAEIEVAAIKAEKAASAPSVFGEFNDYSAASTQTSTSSVESPAAGSQEAA